MADPSHLDILSKGVLYWNDWRHAHPEAVPDLEGADLSRMSLRDGDFRGAFMKGADLRKARLEGADFRQADLTRARLWRADLRLADLRGAHLTCAEFHQADLDGANLHGTRLRGAIFLGASLKEADLSHADLRGADLRRANLRDADTAYVRYDRWARYRGIRAASVHGSMLFRRFAQDQAFIEEFRASSPTARLVYCLWLVFADCGRSLLLWAAWSVAMALVFAERYRELGSGAFDFDFVKLYWGFDMALYYSVVTFTTLGFGDVTPISAEAQRWVMAEVAVGYLMLGGLISIFANKLARRNG